MLRKLLACLALLTGLAAAGAPAQAEVASALASHLEVTAAAQAPAGGVAVLVQGVAQAWPQAVLAALPALFSERPAPLLTVQTGSDRALE